MIRALFPPRAVFHPLLLFLLAADAAGAQSSPSVDVLHALPGSTLTIRGSTTIGAKWHCSSSAIESRVALGNKPRRANELPEVRGVTVFLPVSALRCQGGPMERAMRHALKADRDTAATYISGRFEVVDTIPITHVNEAHLFGGLRVAGKERNVFLHSNVEPQADSALRVRSVIPLTLSGFDIAPPRVLFGAIRARDAITVEVDLLYRPAEARRSEKNLRSISPHSSASTPPVTSAR